MSTQPKPNAIQVAMVAAALLSKSKCSDEEDLKAAIRIAHRLIEMAAEDSPLFDPPEIRLNTIQLAKQLGYVSRNYRNQVRSLIARVWSDVPRASWQPQDPQGFFADFDANGWPERTLKDLKRLHAASKSKAARRIGPRQRKSAD